MTTIQAFADLTGKDAMIFEAAAGDLANDPTVQQAAVTLSEAAFAEYVAAKFPAAVATRHERNRRNIEQFLQATPAEKAPELDRAYQVYQAGVERYKQQEGD